MQKVENGIFVSVAYTGTLDDGEVFDSSEGRPPLEFQAGAGQMIKGFDEAVMGMALNETKEFTLTPEDAYGDYDENRTYKFPRTELPEGVDPKVGDTVVLTGPKGQQVPARLIEMDEENLVFDTNHPLAGQSLTFAIEVVGISDTPTQEPQGCGCGCGSESESESKSGCGCGSGCDC